MEIAPPGHTSKLQSIQIEPLRNGNVFGLRTAMPTVDSNRTVAEWKLKIRIARSCDLIQIEPLRNGNDPGLDKCLRNVIQIEPLRNGNPMPHGRVPLSDSNRTVAEWKLDSKNIRH